jgi:hypothetical protein
MTRIEIVKHNELLTLTHHLVQLANQAAPLKNSSGGTNSYKQWRGTYSITPGAFTRCEKVAAYF